MLYLKKLDISNLNPSDLLFIIRMESDEDELNNGQKDQNHDLPEIRPRAGKLVDLRTGSIE